MQGWLITGLLAATSRISLTMSEGDLTPLETASLHRVPARRSPVLTVLAFITGFLAVMLLGLGILVLVAHSTVNVSLGIDQWGIKRTIWLHRRGLGSLLFGLGVWFTLLTRGLWQRHRYGRVMGWVTIAVIVLIAIILAVS